MTLEFEVKNQTLIRLDQNRVVSDSIAYLKVDFKFTSDWYGFKKLLTFSYYKNVVSVELIDNSTVVPAEVIKSPGFALSIVGKREDVTITTDVYRVIVKEAGESTGVSPANPPKKIYDAFLGGEKGDVLIKNSDEDFDYAWQKQEESKDIEEIKEELSILNNKVEETLSILDDKIDKNLSILEDTNLQEDRSKMYIYVDDNGISKKVSIADLLNSKIRTSNETSLLNNEDYSFVEINK